LSIGSEERRNFVLREQCSFIGAVLGVLQVALAIQADPVRLRLAGIVGIS
jgi:hypothetical protein